MELVYCWNSFTWQTWDPLIHNYENHIDICNELWWSCMLTVWLFYMAKTLGHYMLDMIWTLVKRFVSNMVSTALGMPKSVGMNWQIDWQAQQISHLVCSFAGQSALRLQELSEHGQTMHHSIDHFKERGVEKGSSWHSTFQGQGGSMFNQTNIVTVLRATLGRLLRDGPLAYGPLQALWCHLELKLKLIGMRLSATKLYILIPVWMTLMFTQGHKITGNLELVRSFCCKVAWSNSDICDCWLCKGDDCGEVL